MSITDNLSKSESKQLIKLQQIVKQAIADEKLIVENLVNEPKEILTPGQSISDKVASFEAAGNLLFPFQLYFLFGSHLILYHRANSSLIPIHLS